MVVISIFLRIVVLDLSVDLSVGLNMILIFHWFCLRFRDSLRGRGILVEGMRILLGIMTSRDLKIVLIQKR